MENQNQVPFEQLLGQRMFYQMSPEKTYTDKLLARSEIKDIKDLIKKEDLTRSDLLELLYLLSSAEIKLANFNDWDRYLLGKFLAWIRDFVSMAEIIYDYQDEYKNYTDDSKKQIKTMMTNIRKFILHNIKFLVDIFVYLSRSTLSLNMAAFEAMSKSRYEYAYPNMDSFAPREQEGKSLFKQVSLR